MEAARYRDASIIAFKKSIDLFAMLPMLPMGNG